MNDKSSESISSGTVELDRDLLLGEEEDAVETLAEILEEDCC